MANHRIERRGTKRRRVALKCGYDHELHPAGRLADEQAGSGETTARERSPKTRHHVWLKIDGRVHAGLLSVVRGVGQKHDKMAVVDQCKRVNEPRNGRGSRVQNPEIIANRAGGCGTLNQRKMESQMEQPESLVEPEHAVQATGSSAALSRAGRKRPQKPHSSGTAGAGRGGRQHTTHGQAGTRAEPAAPEACEEDTRQRGPRNVTGPCRERAE